MTDHAGAPARGTTTTDEMVAAAAAYAAGFVPGSQTPRPLRHVAIVTCIDARLDLFRMLGLTPGDAHILRNAGGIVTDDVVRSLVISQGLLGTEEVVLVLHTGCGLLGEEEALRGRIAAAGGVAPPFTLGAFADVDEGVLDGLRRLRASPHLRHRDHVRGFVFDVETGHLREVGEGEG
jgi:carbonic anhydrase